MPEFFPEIDVNAEQAEAIARGLYAVAKSDGNLHVQEKAIIMEFFAGGSDNPADFGILDRAGTIEPKILAGILASDQAKQLFIKTALLCAWADGVYSDGEAAAITEYATACGIDGAELETLTGSVKEFLLAQLTGLKNVDAAVEVAKELDL